MRVFKFGGASLKDATNIKNVGTIIGRFDNEQLVVVVSATGKTTNLLEEVVNGYFNKTDEAQDALDKFKENHVNIAKDLFPIEHEIFALMNDLFVEIDWILEDGPNDPYDYIYDQIVSIGEMVSSRIVHSYLNLIGIKTAWLDARDVIKTDEPYREAKLRWNETQSAVQTIIPPLLNSNKVVITQGFIGGSKDNQTMTLGREGSDYSAAILAFCLNAENQTIWKDVPGVLTADPRKFENTVLLEKLSYREAIEMTYYGASVIHPKTIQPLQKKNIPLLVKSFLDPDSTGTIISGDFDAHYPPMVMEEDNQALLYIAPNDYSFVVEHHLSFLFHLFTEHRIFVNMMQNTALSFVACVTNEKDRLKLVEEALAEEYFVRKEENLKLLTIRHFDEATLEELKRGKIILLEEKLSDTVQMVIKNIPQLKYKES